MSPTSQTTSRISAAVPVRLAARAIDALILAVIGVGLGKLVGFGFDWLIVAAAIVIAYFVASDVFAGATIGKALLSLRVTAFARESFILLGAIPFAGPLLALAA